MRTFVVILKSLLMAGCAVTLFGVVTWQLRRLDPLVPLELPPWLAVFGVLVMAAGAALALASFWTFAAAGALTPHARFPDPEGLVVRGPYRYARNPMTKGGWTVLCGWGLALLSPSVLAFALLMAVLLHLFVVLVEEPKLERRFGDAYREYRRRVNRWVPSWRFVWGRAG